MSIAVRPLVPHAQGVARLIEPKQDIARPGRCLERRAVLLGAVLLFAPIPSCVGGSSGEPTETISPTCLISRVAPPEVQTKFSGTYTTEWGMRASVDHECPPSEGSFEARVEFVVREGDLPRRTCDPWDPDWYTVVVELESSDGSLRQTRTGLLSTHGTVDFDEDEAPGSIELHPDERWLELELYTSTVPMDKPLPPDIVSRPPWCPSGELDGELPDVVETDFGEVELVYQTSYRAQPGPSITLGLLGLTNRELSVLTLTREGRGDMSLVLHERDVGRTVVVDGHVDGAYLADGTIDQSALRFWGEQRIDGSFFAGMPDEVTSKEHVAELSVSFATDGATFVVTSVHLELGSDETSAGLLSTMSDLP